MFAFLILLFSVQSIAAERVSVKYEDLPKLIQEGNGSVQSSRSFVSASEARTGHLFRSYLPTIKAEGGGEYFKTGRYSPTAEPYGGLVASVNVFRGGKDYLEDKITSTQLEISSSNAKRTVLRELGEARKLYWTLVYNKEVIAIMTEALAQNEKNLEMANQRIRRGMSAETDRLEFEIHRSQLTEDIESLKHENQLHEISFAAVLGQKEDTQFETVQKIDHEHDETLINDGSTSAAHPDVVFAKASEESFSLQKSISRRWWMPSIDAYTGYFMYTLRDRDYTSTGLRDDYFVGFKLTLELFDGLQSPSAANAAFYQAQAYEQEASQRQRSLDAQIKVTKGDMKHNHELIHNSEERIAQGKKYLARTLDEYKRGVKNSLDMLGATQKVYGVLKQYAERKRDYQLAKTTLLSLTEK